MSVIETRETRATFMARFEKIYSPEQMEILLFAYEVAKYGHRNQFRDNGVRYFEHVRATALILFDELGITDLDMIVAALLHDMMEDSFLMTEMRMVLNFGRRATHMIMTVTKPKKSDVRFSSDRERHRWYFRQIYEAWPEVILLKLADRLHNSRTIGGCAPEKQERKNNETREVYLPLIDLISDIYPSESQYLRSEILKVL